MGSLNPRSRRTVHRLFEVGILVKGIDGVLEFVGGLLLLALSPSAIGGIVAFFVQAELKEDPTDLVANLLLHTSRNVIQNKVIASAFLIVHGAAKLLLVLGLLANRAWSYPIAILVFAGFTIYQGYQLSQAYSLFLVVITVLDIAVILLVVVEYRYARMAAGSADI